MCVLSSRRATKNDYVAYPVAWQYCVALAFIVTKGYSSMWPEKRLCFALDNFNSFNNYHHQRRGRNNNAHIYPSRN